MFSIIVNVPFSSPVRFKNESFFSRLSSKSQMSMWRNKFLSLKMCGTQISNFKTKLSYCMWSWRIEFDKFNLNFSSCYSSICFNQCFYFIFISFNWFSKIWRIFNVEILKTSFNTINTLLITLLIIFLHRLHIIFFLPEHSYVFNNKKVKYAKNILLSLTSLLSHMKNTTTQNQTNFFYK